MQTEAQEHYKRVAARLARAPEMEFSSVEAWLAAKAAADLHTRAALFYAERWARMMQFYMSEGKSLAETWSRASIEADLDGTGASSTATATQLLYDSWIHGAELRRLIKAYWEAADD